MPQLLVFAKDFLQESTKISPQQLAGLYHVGDLICWRPFERIVDISWSDGLVRIETENTHHIYVGMPIEVRGLTPDGFNGIFKAIEGTEGIIVIFELKDDPGKVELLGTIGWPWSEKERKDPMFRILEWHGKDPSELDIMLKSRFPLVDENNKPTESFLIREFKYDITQMDQSIQVYFSDVTRVDEKLDITAVPIDGTIVLKPSVPLDVVGIISNK